MIHSSRIAALLLLVSPALSLAQGLEPALEAVTTQNVKSDIFFIASDEMQGRDTPSEEIRIAARFLRSRLMRLGFEEGGTNGYFHEYLLDSSAIDLAGTSASLEGGPSLSFGTDYWFRSRSVRTDSESAGGVLYAGSSDADRDLDGLEGIAGSWLAFSDDGRSTGRLRRDAEREEAAGLILIEPEAGEYAVRFEGSKEKLVKGSVSYPSERRGGEASAPFPTLHLTRQAWAKLCGHSSALPEGVSADAWVPERGTDLELKFTERRKAAGDGGVTMENVCGFWRGSDPELSKDVIIVSAHYDHVGARDGEIYNGADDNGSGTCGLLAVSEALAAYGPMRRSVMLIWVSGEEKGLWGSRAWSDNPHLPEGCKPVANLNIDMIGRNEPEKLMITPSPEHEKYNGMVKFMEDFAKLEGFPKLGNADDYYHRSDQAMFERLGIPVAFLFSDIHEDYHKPTDTPDKIDCDKIRRVVRTVVRMLDAMQTDKLDF
jgi:hypothetical protein